MGVYVPGSSVSFVITRVTTRSCCSTISCLTQMTGPSSVTSVNTPRLKKSSWSPIWPSNTQVRVAEHAFMFMPCEEYCTKPADNMLSWMCPLQERSLSLAICVTSRPSTGRIYGCTCSVATLRHLRSGPWLTPRNRSGSDAGLFSPCSSSRSSNNNMTTPKACRTLL